MSETEFTYFPGERWLNQAIDFPQSSSPFLLASSWKPTRRISESSMTYTREEAEKDWNEQPIAHATFECENNQDPNKLAILEVWMQIPYQGTLLSPRVRREEQAWDSDPDSVKIGIDAYKLLHEKNCEYTPHLMGYLKGKQDKWDPAGFVPGGNIYYVVVSKVPGVPLGDALLQYTGDGRAYDAGFFWDVCTRAMRDQIRDAFSRAYEDLLKAEVTICMKTLSKLFWDQGSENVYIQGAFEVLNPQIPYYPSYSLEPYGPKVLRIWRLAIAPDVRDVDYNVAIDKLEEMGWIL